MAESNINIIDEQKRALNFILNHIAKSIRKDCIIGWESNIEVKPMEMTTEIITIKINRTLLDHDDEQGNITDQPLPSGEQRDTLEPEIGVLDEIQTDTISDGQIPASDIITPHLFDGPQTTGTYDPTPVIRTEPFNRTYQIEGNDFYVGMEFRDDVHWLIPARVHVQWHAERHVFEVLTIDNDQINQSLRNR